MGKRIEYDPEVVRKVCEESGSMMAAARRLNLHFTTFRKIAREVGCYAPNQSYKPAGFVPKHLSREDIEKKFLSNERPIGASKLRRLLLREGFKKAMCEGCGQSEWRGKPIPLELHHKDGNKYNNSLDNLAVLCPNCHSWETDGNNRALMKRESSVVDKGYLDISELKDSYVPHNSVLLSQRLGGGLSEGSSGEAFVGAKAGVSYKPPVVTLTCKGCGGSFTIRAIYAKGRAYCSPLCAKKASRRFDISKGELLEAFKADPNYTHIGKRFGVNGNSVKRRCKALGIFDEVSALIQQERSNRGERAVSNLHTRAYVEKGVISRRLNIDDFVGYRVEDLSFVEVCRYSTQAALEAAGYSYEMVRRVCKGERKSYRDLIWRREKKKERVKTAHIN